MVLSKPHIIDIPTIRDPRGSLSVIDSCKNINFDVARAYWIYDVPSDALRHGHAFYTQCEIIVAMAGSFDVIVKNGIEEKTFHLDRPYRGLVVPPLTWRSINNFSTLSMALIMSSELYDETDYIRDFNEYLSIKQK